MDDVFLVFHHALFTMLLSPIALWSIIIHSFSLNQFSFIWLVSTHSFDKSSFSQQPPKTWFDSIFCIDCGKLLTNSIRIRDAVVIQWSDESITYKIRAVAIACGAVMKKNSVGVFVRYIHGRTLHLGVHETHPQMHVIHPVEKVAEVTATHLPSNLLMSISLVTHVQFSCCWSI